MLRLSFDLDDTLIATKDLIKASYREAGVDFRRIDFDNEAWGLPWYEWLPYYCGNDYEKAERIHQKKNELYARRINKRFYTLLPPYKLFFEAVKRSWGPVIMTGASKEAVEIICNVTMLESHHFISTSMSPYDKRAYLRANDGVIHLDNDEETVKFIEELELPVIHYTNQTIKELKDELGWDLK